MNHFFAIEIPSAAADELAQVAMQWQALLPKGIRVRWDDSVNYHITLNFLGNLSRTQQPRLVRAGAPVARSLSPFVIHVTHVGAFPDTRQPGVLWAGLAQKKETAAISKQIDAVLHEHGFAIPKHSYVPHITLGRCRNGEGPEENSPIKTSVPIQIAIPVDRFVLMETLPPEARQNAPSVRYNTVHTFPFGDTHS